MCEFSSAIHFAHFKEADVFSGCFASRWATPCVIMFFLIQPVKKKPAALVLWTTWDLNKAGLLMRETTVKPSITLDIEFHHHLTFVSYEDQRYSSISTNLLVFFANKPLFFLIFCENQIPVTMSLWKRFWFLSYYSVDGHCPTVIVFCLWIVTSLSFFLSRVIYFFQMVTYSFSSW